MHGCNKEENKALGSDGVDFVDTALVLLELLAWTKLTKSDWINVLPTDVPNLEISFSIYYNKSRLILGRNICGSEHPTTISMSYLPKICPNETKVATSTCWYSCASLSASLFPASPLLALQGFEKFEYLLENVIIFHKDISTLLRVNEVDQNKIIRLCVYLHIRTVISLQAANWAFSPIMRPNTTWTMCVTHL